MSDPWNTVPFELQLGKNSIIGPVSNEESLQPFMRHTLEFIYEENDDSTYNLYTNHIYLKINKDETVIQNISKSEIYTVSEYLLFILQIMYRLNHDIIYNKVELRDFSFIYNDDTYYSIIISLLNGSSFYIDYGFNAYDKNTMMIKTQQLKDKVSKLWEISWQEVDLYIKKVDYYTISFWNDFKEKYSRKSPTLFRTFFFLNVEECHKVIIWLEELYVYSHQRHNFSDGDMIQLFKSFKDEVNNVVWINSHTKNQPMSCFLFMDI